MNIELYYQTNRFFVFVKVCEKPVFCRKLQYAPCLICICGSSTKHSDILFMDDPELLISAIDSLLGIVE
jgi:hypothetical protein